MSFSPNLDKIVNNFHSIDPTQTSINESFEQVGKRVWWQNFLGNVFHIITCGLIPKNPILDRATKKIVNLTNEFFETNKQPSHDQLIALKQTFIKLETIISNNQGARFAQVHELAGKVATLLNNEKPEAEPNALPKDDPKNVDESKDPTQPQVDPQPEEPKETLFSFLSAIKLPDFEKEPSQEEIASIMKSSMEVRQKIIDLLSAGKEEEVVAAYNQAAANEGMFEMLTNILPIIFDDKEAAKALTDKIIWPSAEAKEEFESLKWPTAEEKTQTLQMLQVMTQANEKPAKGALCTLLDQLEMPGPVATLEELAALTMPLTTIMFTMKNLLESGEQEEIAQAFTHVSSDEKKFLSLVKVLPLACQDKDVVINLLRSVSWPSDEMKKQELTSLAQNYPTQDALAFHRNELIQMTQQGAPSADAPRPPTPQSDQEELDLDAIFNGEIEDELHL